MTKLSPGRRAWRGISAMLTGLATLSALGDARADWPMARHDVDRTAASNNPSDLATPTIAWRLYIGGSLEARQVVATDVNRNGSVDVVLVSGGRLVAKRADDSIIWETPPFDLFRIDSIRDLNNDGTLDVVATGRPGRVMVFNGRDGRVEWQTTSPPFGPSIGAVRFARLDADELEDMYVTDAACGSTDNRGDTAFAYSFARGFGTGIDSGEQRIWQLEQGRDYNCGNNDVVADLNGDGRPEVVAFGTRFMYLFDGRTGAKIASGDPADPQGGYAMGFSLPYGQVITDVIDVDGDGHLDIVGYTNNSYAPTINSRTLFVVSYTPSNPRARRLHVRWSRPVADVDADLHAFVQNGAADFDGDGRAEIATTFREGGTTTTYLFDGATGTVRASIPGVSIRGVFTLAEGERPTLLVQRGSSFEGYRFDAASTPDAGVPSPVFTIPAGSLLSYFRPEEWASGSASIAQLALAIQGTTRRGIVQVRNNVVELWDAAMMPPVAVATYPLPDDVSVMTAAPEQDVAEPGPGILLARSDGYLIVLDQRLRAINFGGTTESSLPGIRTGGYYSGSGGLGPIPIAARFDRSAAEILAINSRGRLLRLDASMATITQGPTPVWEWSGARSPLAIDENGDGAHDLIVAQVGSTLVGRRPDGTTQVFRVPVVTGQQTFHGDVLPMRGPGGSTQYAVPIRDNGNGDGLVAAVTPSRIAWTANPIVVAGSGFGHPSIDDVDGDGVDDVLISMQSQIRLFSGSDGTLLASGESSYTRFPVNVRGRAGAVTHLFSGTYREPRGVTIAGTPPRITQRWTFPTGVFATGLGGAVVECPSGLMFANALFGGSHVVIVDAASGTVRADMVLAGGRQFADDAALAATNVFPGLFGNITATSALYAGQPAFLAGSTDGYLYAIDPCASTPRLLWAMNFRAPVGEAILADTDGDGQDEIAVEAADGFLYGIDTQRFPAPAWVNDVEPRGTSTDDIDETRSNELAAAWAEVPGATGYEWAVFTAGGTPVSRNANDAGAPGNPFTQVPATTRRVTFGEGIEDGRRYFFAVRAIGPTGTSSEVVSDGTRFVRTVLPMERDDAPDAGMMVEGGMDAAGPRDDAPMMPPASNCACRAPGAPLGARGSAAFAALAAAAIPIGARRRRHAD